VFEERIPMSVCMLKGNQKIQMCVYVNGKKKSSVSVCLEKEFSSLTACGEKKI